MHKNFILFTLLFLWVFAIVAPTVITLVERSPKSVVMNTLNEEEHQKQGKKDVGEKQIINSTSINSPFLISLKGTGIGNNQTTGYSTLPKEILLPPPRIS